MSGDGDGDGDDELTMLVAAAVGAPHGMSAGQVLAYLAIGDRRHGDAPADECGAVDPRVEDRWCRLQVGHPADHNRYLPEQLTDPA